MKLVNITKKTEGTFFRCLHDEIPENSRTIKLRRRWYDKYKDKGLRAKVLIDNDKVVGLCQYIPIEHSHLIGENLIAILCIWVHGYVHHIGNQQGKGYGKFILNCIEEDARKSGADGVAAWGMDFPHWNPVSFYEHAGYSIVEKNGQVVLVWKPSSSEAKPPELMRRKKTPAKGKEKTKVTALVNGWCLGGCGQCVSARDAVVGLDDIVEYEEIDTSDRKTMLSWGLDDNVFLEDEEFMRFEPPWKPEELRAEIIQLHEQKK